MNIAIIGAGLSGANLYSLLKKEGHLVTVFEKSRGAGGRCSTRYVNDKLIDHGTSYFECDDERFKIFCNDMEKKGILKSQNGIFYPTNGMNKLCSYLIQENDLIKNTKIVTVKQIDGLWKLIDENGIKFGSFDKVVLTIPSVQVLQMQIDLEDNIKNLLEKVVYKSAATLMLYSNKNQILDIEKILKEESFEKVIDNSSKYGYKNFSSYVVHLKQNSINDFSFQTKEEVKTFIIDKLSKIEEKNIEDDFYVLPHLWKYAFVSKNLEEPYLYDDKGLAFCGDYFKYKNLQGAYLSSLDLFLHKFAK